MRKSSRRPFTLADVMVLVAASAAAMAAARHFEAAADPGLRLPGQWLWMFWWGRPTCYAVACAAALVPLRWVRPRPSMARIARQPGAVACVATLAAVLVGLGLGGLEGLVFGAGSNGSRTYFGRGYHWGTAIGMIPPAVAGAWTALAAGGRWSPEPTWIDRLGRALGIYWLAWLLALILHTLVAYLIPHVYYLG